MSTQESKPYDQKHQVKKTMIRVENVTPSRAFTTFIDRNPQLSFSQGKLRLTVIKGKCLFSAKESSLCHCVSEDFAMGMGIALEFKRRFGNVDNLLAQKKKVGDVAFIKENDRFIFYLVTKQMYFLKPTYQTLWDALCKLASLCVENQVKKLSMPLIGCGLDKLEWKNVFILIDKAFANTDVQLRIYTLKELTE
jgi:hypothetical protein